MRNPLRLLSDEFKTLEKAELTRRAMVDFADIRGMLHHKDNGISWDALSKNALKKNDKMLLPDKHEIITIQLAKPRQFLRKIHWGKVSKDKNGKDGKQVRLINIRISYEPVGTKGKEINFDWRLVVTRPLPTSTNPATQGPK